MRIDSRHDFSRPGLIRATHRGLRRLAGALTAALALNACTTLPGPAASAAQPAHESASSAAQITRSRVATLERVIDGDTIAVRERSGKPLRVRLGAIDAPEMDQAGGPASRRYLQAQLANQPLRIRAGKKDRYGRLVATVYAGPRDINLDLVRAGMAWYYRRFSKELSQGARKAYDAAEHAARRAGRGLWAQRGAIAPWQHRSGKR